MVEDLSQEALEKLHKQQVIWFGSVRPDGRPHLAPVWFAWLSGRIFVSTDPKSVKVRNIRDNPRVSLALEDGVHPVICEGTARFIPEPWTEEIRAAFLAKYEWDLTTETQYNQVIEVTPTKWLVW